MITCPLSDHSHHSLILKSRKLKCTVQIGCYYLHVCHLTNTKIFLHYDCHCGMDGKE